MTVAVFGEALIDLVGGDDGTYRAHLGGSPYNFAIALARLGVEVAFLAPFSDDAFGERLRSSLHRDGVATPIARRSRQPTSLAIVTVGVDGAPSYRLYRHGVADTDIGCEEIAAYLPSDLALFHTGSLALAPAELPTIKKLMPLLRKQGALVSIDVNIRLGAAPDNDAYVEGVRSLLPLADIVKASDEDLAALSFHSDPRRSAEIAYETMRGGLLVVTQGSAGAVLHAAIGTVAAAAYPVTAVVDTIGAGDVFHAAFIAHLTRGEAVQQPLDGIHRRELAAALDFACAAAAINVSRAGCAPPSSREVEAFMQAHRSRRQPS